MSRATPQSLIQLEVDRHSDKTAAIAALVSAANGSPSLRDYLVQLGAKTAVGDRIRSDNAKIFNDNPDADVTIRAPLRVVGNEAPLISGAHKARIRSTIATLQLMAVRLPNGTVMARACKADIAHAVATYEPQAADMLHKAAYYRAVLAKLPEGKAVADAFTDKTLTSLYEQTRPRESRDAA